MRFPEPLVPGKLISRYKRFFADIALDTGETVTAHCANSGSMTGLKEPGSTVLISKSSNPKRKLAFTWELVKVRDTWVCVNTLMANRVIYAAISGGHIPALANYCHIKREVKWRTGTRFDFFLEDREGNRCFVEVKSVTLAEKGIALFPDAVTKRGTRHLEELIQAMRSGFRSVIVYLVNRDDCSRFEPAAEIDPVYAQSFKRAIEAGVEVLVYGTRVTPREIAITHKLNA